MLILLAFAILFAMLLNPIADKLESKGIKRPLSTTICIIITLLVVSLFAAILSIQISKIIDQLPEIQQKFEMFMNQFQTFIQEKFNISPEQQIGMVKRQVSGLGKTGFNIIKGFSMGFFGLIGYFAMIMVFVFLFLYQREKYKSFFVDCFTRGRAENPEEIVTKIVNVAHHYLVGILISMGILTILYSIGFLIIGLKNAILLAAIAASLIIIPYIGSFIGGTIACFMALVTEGSPNVALGVMVIMVIIQIIDNNFIEPYVIGGQVRLSAAASIVAIIAGGLLWGMPGVFLSLPLTGIVKVIFDHTESLKRYGNLIGDSESKAPSSQIMNWFKGKFKN